MPVIALRGTKVHYQQTGSGPDVLLIHGLSCNIAFWWFHVAQALAHSHRVTAVDLRGHGFSGMTPTGYRAVDLAADVAALLQHLGMSDVHVIGHSYGGAVAAALASERPDLVGELTLVDAWIPSLQPVPPLPSDWALTRSRARARGIEIEANMPFVVRALYAELLDEMDIQEESLAGRSPLAEGINWSAATQDPAQTPPQGQGHRPLNNRGWLGSRFGRVFNRAPGAEGTRPGWPGRPGRPWERGPGTAPAFSMPGGADRDPADPPVADASAMAAASRPGSEDRSGQGRQALDAAFVLTGAPGKPSRGLRRWQELMRTTEARAEFMDMTAIEPSSLRDISAPVRLVYGSRSLYRPGADSLKTLLPQARLGLVPRAAHYFPLLRPQALIEALRETPEPLPAPRSGPPELRVVASADADGSPKSAEDRERRRMWFKAGPGNRLGNS